MLDLLESRLGPHTDEVIFSAEPPNRLYMPGGYHALYDLAQYEWADPPFLVILGDTPFDGVEWGDAVPGSLHLIAWESATWRLPLDSGIAVWSSLAAMRAAYPGLVVGIPDVCDTEFLPAGFIATSSDLHLYGLLDWDWVTEVQTALNERGATLVPDGIYGPKTRAAVEQFQQANGLDRENGLIGPETLDALGVHAPSNALVKRIQAGYRGSC